MINQTTGTRFWRRVNVAGPDECWEWQGCRQKFGHGRMTIGNGAVEGTHRVSWMLHTGAEIPVGMCICHTCDNPPCVNPAHLFLGTKKDNATDMVRKGRCPKRKGIPARKGDRHAGKEWRRARGSRIGSCKLNELEVLDIRRLYALGNTSYPKLAVQFNISKTQVGAIINRIKWKHI